MFAVEALNVTFLVSQVVLRQDVRYFFNDPYLSAFESKTGPRKSFSYEYLEPFYGTDGTIETLEQGTLN